MKGGVPEVIFALLQLDADSFLFGNVAIELFYVTLGNLSIVDPNGLPAEGGLGNGGPFSGLRGEAYWLDAPYDDGVGLSAWYFSTAVGVQGSSNQGNPLFAWAVHEGDIASPAPEPATWGLMLGGLTIVALGRRRRS